MKSGYKQSEIGVIPEDWDIKLLGDLGTVVRGGSPRPAGDPRYFKGDFIPWLTVAALTNISEHQLIVSETVDFLTEAGSKLSRILTDGTLIIANSGATLGVSKLLGITCCANDGIAAIINQRLGNKLFVCFYINTQTKNLREVIATGNGQPNLNTSLIREIAIPFPPEPEQRVIANALSDVDALLYGLDRLIAKKRDLKTAVMQQLLTGKTRLPGFEGEWEVIRLEDVADPAQRWSLTGGPFGSNLKSSDYTNEGIRIIQLQNIGDGVFLNDYKIYTSKIKADELISCNIYPGEIILSKMGDPVARACIIPPIHNRYLMCSDGIRLAVDQDRFCTYFIYTMINAPEFREAASDAGTGSTRKRIGLTELRNLELKCPPLPEQHAISTILSDMDAELVKLEQRRDKTQDLKQAMMQELLTGRTRLV